MARVAWVLTDDVLNETYSLPVNPHTDMGSFGYTKSIEYESGSAFYQSTSGPQIGRNVLFHSGNYEESSFSFEGFVYTPGELDELTRWVNKDYAVYLTDDLGRTFKVLFRSLTPERVRSRNRDKVAYSISGVVLEEVEDLDG